MRKTLNSLQAGRAMAAVAVLVHHANIGTTAFVDRVPNAFSNVFSQGYLGVDFFFVLSGFIIYYTASRMAHTFDAATTFAQKRLIRIFVPYLPIGILLACVYSALPSVSAVDRDWSWFATVTLLPSFHPPALSVAWTLQYELVFYGMFCMFFFSRMLLAGMAAWSLLIVAALVLNLPLAEPLRFLLSPIDLEFSFGMIAAWIVLTNRKLPGWIIVPGVAVPLLLFCLVGFERTWSPLVGLAIAFAIVPVCRAELSGRLKVSAWLLLLGEASYAIYLVHNPLVSVLSRLEARIPGLQHWPLSLAVTIIVSLLAGLTYHLGYERWAMKGLKSLRPPRPVRA